MQSGKDKSGGELPPRLEEIARDLAHRLEEEPPKGGAVAGLSTGYARLDELTGGLHRGQLTVILGPRVQASGAFLHNLLWHVASVKRIPVGFFCLDMCADYATERLLCLEAGTDWQALRQGTLPEEELRRLIRVCFEATRDVPLYVDHCQGEIFIFGPIARAKESIEKFCLGLVALDRPTLLVDPDGADRKTEMEAQRLKQLAQESNIPVILCDVLDGGQVSPSGMLDNVADVILLLEHPPHETDEAIGRKTMRVVVSRNRNGPVSSFEVGFDARSLRHLPAE